MSAKELMKRLEKAFKHVERARFMRTRDRHLAPIDAAFSIGQGQTISQPYTVKHMLMWLEPEAGQRVLDVGSGSGWTTALLAHLVGPKGEVYAVERVPELKQFGEKNCRKFGCPNVQFHLAGNELGLPQYAPYDRILVSAASDTEVPQTLIDQIAPNGKMVIPVNHSIDELKKDEGGNIAYHNQHHGYSFVPLIVASDMI